MAPDHSAATGSPLTAVSRMPSTEEIWWISPQGSVEGSFWYKGMKSWTRYQIAPPGSAGGHALRARSRKPQAMELWWVGPQVSIEGAW